MALTSLNGWIFFQIVLGIETEAAEQCLCRVINYTGVIFLRAERVSRVDQPTFKAVLLPR